MKKYMGLILILICLINIFPMVSFAETESAASAELVTNTPSLVNMTEVVYGNGKTPKTETVGDVSDVWTLDNTDKGGYYIGFNLDDSLANKISDGSVFDIEIDYYSRGNGFFKVIYDSQKKSERSTDVILTGNGGTWRTAKITVDDAYFNNRVKNRFDFIISIESPRYYQSQVSAAAVPVKTVRVTRHIAQNTITHYGYTNETGNAFPYYLAEKTLCNEFKNTLRSSITAEVTYRAMDSDGVERWRKTEDITLVGKKTTTTYVNVDIDRCGLYTLYVDIKSEKSNIDESFKRYNFAILKTDPMGIKNENYYLTTHFEHYGPNVDDGLDVIAKSNTYGVRAGFGWTNVYDPSDRTNNIYKDADKTFHLKLRENDLHLMATFGFSVTAETGGWKYLPKTEVALQSWSQAIEFITKNTKGLVERIEIWNEPNILDFNGGVGYTGAVDSYYGVKEPPEVYAEAAKAAMIGAKKGNPDVKVGVMSIVNLGSGGKVIDKTYNFFKTAMIDKNLQNSCDAVTFHPYSDGSAEQYHKMGNIEKMYTDTLSNKTAEVWNTEYGFSTTDQASPTEQRQANNVVRTPIHMMGEGVGDVNVGYNFAQKGFVPTNREDNFGMVSPGFEGGADKFDKNFVPRQAYVALAAMNYYLAQATPDGEGNHGDVNPVDKKNDFDGEYIYKFNSRKFDADIYAIWRTEKETEKEFDLGIKSVIYADMNGNEEIIKSENGKYTFTLGSKPAYIIVKSEDAEFEIDGVALMNNTDGQWKKSDIDSMKSSDVVKAVVRGYNPDDEERSVMLVTAFYKNGENGSTLVKAEAADVALSGKGFVTAQHNFSVPTETDYDVCKCFVWDKDGLVPYIKNAVIN